MSDIVYKMHDCAKCPDTVALLQTTDGKWWWGVTEIQFCPFCGARL
jgi:hypothetical protein